MEQTNLTNETVKTKKPRSEFLTKWRDTLIHFLCISPLLVIIIVVGIFAKNDYSSSSRILAIVLGVIICTIITFVIPQIIMFIKHRKGKKSITETKASV